MLTESELRERLTNLLQRAEYIWSRSQARIDTLTTATQVLPELHPDEYLRMVKGATDDATMAALGYHRSLPFLETAISLLESLAQPSPSTEEIWRGQLLFRLDEVLKTAANLIVEGEEYLASSERIDV
ncbi:hypothetical protein G5S35_36880 [Paraburkholderia tropica]|uniref:hypothetical protein n=1 Tax=Paraburkholderia tropica TaxID=92647 RepID=UPI0016004A40|nr:hypothetical protein [Paraburkholderia tropica]QNB17104.1 hypothetical protein G5S35_36880 [Paraburkholderia tropica]